MSQNRVCIRSVFEKNMGPYEVCIFVNIGPFEKTAALSLFFVMKSTFSMEKLKLDSFNLALLSRIEVIK